MAIQWYPGHMHKAQKQIRQILPKVDLIIEVLDARIPFSSENPAIRQLRGDKPCIKLFSKSDLADPEQTKLWQAYYEREKGVKTLAITTEQPALAKQIPNLCRKLLPPAKFKTVHAMIMGIPNVGKSTLINTLVGRPIAKTGNEPAVTKRQQNIKLGDDVILVDTPGFLWPNIHNEHSGYRLAASGAIRDTAIEYEDVASYSAAFLLQAYPERLQQRYKLQTLPDSENELLEIIAHKRGGLRSGGRIDYHKASEVLLSDLRSGALGKLTLETPQMAEVEWAAVEVKLEQKRLELEAKKTQRKGSRQS